MEKHEIIPSQPKPETNQSPTEMLRSLDVRVEEAPDAPELHAPISSDGLESFDMKRLTLIVDTFREYARFSIIRDDFYNNHQKREDLLSMLPPAVKEAYERNKMRGNKVISLHSGLAVMVRWADTNHISSPQAEKIRQLLTEFPQGFRRYTDSSTDTVEPGKEKERDDEKEAIVREVDRICRKFLRVVTDTETPEDLESYSEKLA